MPALSFQTEEGAAGAKRTEADGPGLGRLPDAGGRWRRERGQASRGAQGRQERTGRPWAYTAPCPTLPAPGGDAS